MYDDKNHNVTQDIGRTLEEHKGFTTAYSNPRNGIIIVRYHDNFNNKDMDYILEITPIENQSKDFSDTVKKLHYLFD